MWWGTTIIIIIIIIQTHHEGVVVDTCEKKNKIVTYGSGSIGQKEEIRRYNHALWVNIMISHKHRW